MPGISFSFSADGEFKDCSRAIFRTLKHFSDYQCDEYLNDSPFFLGFSGYAEYPRHYYEDESVSILLEGCIYNVENDRMDVTLCNLSRLLSRQELNTSQVENWLRKTDGDFVVFIYHKKNNNVYIINDLFGRLPFYYFSDDTIVLASREHSFILRQMPSVQFDRMGIALMLLFTYTIGERTIWKNVNYLEGGSLLRIDLNTAECRCLRVCNLNYETLEGNQAGPDDIDDLVMMFRKASVSRAISHSHNIVGLSGGLDSRAVAAALEPYPLIGVTRLSINKKEWSEVPVAKLVADSLTNMTWSLVQPVPPTGADLLTLMKMKGGLNSLEMCFKVPFLKEVRNKYGSGFRYFTGDGGDRVKPHFTCRKKMHSVHDLVKYVINRFQVCPLSVVSKLTNIPVDEVVHTIESYLLNCPETSLKHKYIHFQIYESAFKWVFEGEDHNRFYFWSVTPFYGIEFFLKLMNTPDEYKHHYRLYREFLMKLSPTLAGIDNQNWNLPITSFWLRYKLQIKELFHSMPSVFRSVIHRILRPSSVLPSPEFVRCMQEMMASEETKKMLADYFSLSEINHILENLDKQSNAVFYMLFTLMTAIEAIIKDDVTLSHFADSDMI